MAWHEVCILCGIAEGPKNLVGDEPNIQEAASALAAEIRSLMLTSTDDATASTSMSESNLVAIIEDALSMAVHDDLMEVPSWFRDHIRKWPGLLNDIAMGNFDAHGECPKIWEPGPVRPDEGKKYKRRHFIFSGDDIEVRMVRGNWPGGMYDTIVLEQHIQRQRTECSCSINDGVGNVFVHGGCWIYLQAWLDVSAPNRLGSHSGIPLSLEGEFYEIVNSREEKRRYTSPGIGMLPEVTYGGIENACDQYQDFFWGARSSSAHLARAIVDGLRGADLIEPLRVDFECWMAVRPDKWPSPESFPSPWTAPIFPPAEPQMFPNAFSSLPTELSLHIFHFFTTSDILRFAYTSKSVWNAMMEPYMFNHIMREILFHGSLRWILPVEGARFEVETMDNVAKKWLSLAIHGPSESTAKPLASPLFPYYPFLRACYNSDSMMNRRRLWGIVKQFDSIWSDYRLHGWQRDVFVDSDGNIPFYDDGLGEGNDEASC